MEPVQLVQINTYQSNTYREDISFSTISQWFKRDRKWTAVLHIHFCSLSKNFKGQLGAPALAWKQYSIHACMVDLYRYRTTSRKKLYRMNQGSNFLGGSFSNRDNARSPIQFNIESQAQPGVILEIEGSIRQRYKRAFFPYKNL